MMRVRLTSKLAPSLNGLDVSRICVGDIVDLPTPAATMLIAEGWAEPVDDRPAPSQERKIGSRV